MELAKVTLDMLGQAETVTVNKENTTIVNGSGLERGYRIACSPD